MPAVTPEIWTVKQLGIAVANVLLDVPRASTCAPDPASIVAFFQSIRQGAPLGSIVLAQIGGGPGVGYQIIDGRSRVEAIARVLWPQRCPDQQWPLHLLPPDRGGAIVWGLPDEAAALPLHAMSTTIKFLGWCSQLQQGEPNADRAAAVLDAAYAACRMLDTPIMVYHVREATPEELEDLRRRANRQFGPLDCVRTTQHAGGHLSTSGNPPVSAPPNVGALPGAG